MPDLDIEIRDALERLTGPVGETGGVSFERLVARRRRRRIRRAAVAVTPALLAIGLVGGGLSIAADRGEPDVAAGTGPPTTDARGGVTVIRIEVVAERVATNRVVMEFDRPLPDDEVTYVWDLTVVNRPTIAVYTAQGPQGAHVCAGTHFFGASAVGTVDLLLPSTWFAESDGAHTSELDEVGGPPKFVVCGPHRGFYQYSIWGPASSDPLDVDVTIDDDRKRLTIEIAPASAATTASGPAPATEQEEEERSRVCGYLIRAADASRLQLDELDRTIAEVTEQLAAAVDGDDLHNDLESLLEELRARRGPSMALAAEARAEAEALGC